VWLIIATTTTTVVPPALVMKRINMICIEVKACTMNASISIDGYGISIRESH
jgi:hypothetical protein